MLKDEIQEGTRVRIISHDDFVKLLDAQEGNGDDGDIVDCEDHVDTDGEERMLKYAGKLATVRIVNSNAYQLDIDRQRYYWCGCLLTTNVLETVSTDW